LRRLVAFFALPAADRSLLLRALATLLIVRLALALVPIARLRAWAICRATRTAAIGRLVWSVGAASRALPGTTCLASAFALQRLLSRAGHASELHIGVARSAEKFAAHAWLTCEGQILVGEEVREGFTPLVAWPSVESS
jgi:hypothetical protein